MVSAPASSTSHTQPGGDSSVDWEPHIYEELPSLLPNAQLPSSKSTEIITAVDQPKQNEDVPAWAPGNVVTGKYYFSGPDPSVSICNIVNVHVQTPTVTISHTTDSHNCMANK